MNSEEVWVREMEKLVSELQSALHSEGLAAEREIKELRSVNERALNTAERQRQQRTLQAERLKVRAEQLRSMRGDPVVVYSSRTAGPDPSYHNAEDPCGHAARIDHPTYALLSDVIPMKRMRRCSACGPKGP